MGHLGVKIAPSMDVGDVPEVSCASLSEAESLRFPFKERAGRKKENVRLFPFDLWCRGFFFLWLNQLSRN